MNSNSIILINQLKETQEDRLMINMVQQLRPYMADRDVLTALCSVSVKSIDPQLRNEIIRAIQSNRTAAKQWFIDCALISPKSSERRWALINLSLMQCRSAKTAVLKGLKDLSRKVRIAAAFNLGLYYDDEVIKALETYFVTGQFDVDCAIIEDDIVPN